MMQVSGQNLNVPPARPTSTPAGGAAPAPADNTPRETVTLGQYNIENWFTPAEADPAMGKRVKSQAELDQMARNIDQSGADVVTLNEVGTNLENVKAFFAQKLPGKFPFIAMAETNDARGVHVAVASKYPITNVVSHTDARFPLADGSGETKFSRDLLRADIDVKGIPMTIYTTHAKSRRVYAPGDPAHPGGENPDNQRIAEGREAVRIMQSEMKAYPGRFYALMGDLNDGTEDKSVQAILNPPGGDSMVDTLQGQPEKERRTWPADPRKGHGHGPEQFDHIIVPASQRDKVLDSHVVDIPGVSQQASDHLQIVAKVSL